MSYFVHICPLNAIVNWSRDDWAPSHQHVACSSPPFLLVAPSGEYTIKWRNAVYSLIWRLKTPNRCREVTGLASKYAVTASRIKNTTWHCKIFLDIIALYLTSYLTHCVWRVLTDSWRRLERAFHRGRSPRSSSSGLLTSYDIQRLI